MDRLRHLTVLASLVVVLAGCGEKKAGPAGGGATGGPGVALAPMDMEAAKSFCDKVWPESGPGAVSFSPPALRKLGGDEPTTEVKAGGWRWINFWATWCAPCLEEMPLLGRWMDAMRGERAPVTLELWSLDEDENKLRDWLRREKPPGVVRWVQSTEALSGTLKQLGLDENAALPIHMLIGPGDQVRCARVGFVHANDYGTIRRIIGL